MDPTISLPTVFSRLQFFHFEHFGQEGIVAYNTSYTSAPFLRIHSSCLFSEAFRTQDCDCSKQLEAAIKYIEENGGIIVYLYQEGRGLGLKKKIEAIFLEQTEGMDTATAFSTLGHTADPRNYDAVIEVLKKMGISTVTLATNNPLKAEALTRAGIQIASRVNLSIESNPLIENYLNSKKVFLGHYEED